MRPDTRHPHESMPCGGEIVTRLDPAIVRKYDIRGIADTELGNDVIAEIADRFATYLKHQGLSQVIVGHDNRISSERIHRELINVLLRRGCGVVDLGETTTPVVSFSAATLDVSASAMITGSHNPAPYNGIKLQVDSAPLWGDRLQSIFTAERSAELLGTGTYSRREMNSFYVSCAAQSISALTSKVVVVDCGNGSAATVAPAILRAVGCDVRELFCESDGRFPHHHPDPADIGNLSSLVEEVRRQDADLGFAFDGDGNRIGVVAAGGRILSSDETLAYTAKQLLDSDGAGGVVVTEVKLSDAVEKVVAAAGGRVEVSPVGYPYIFEQMIRTGAIVAGEGTGHIFLNTPPFHQGDVTYLAAWLSTRPGIVEHLRDGWDYPEFWTSKELRVALNPSTAEHTRSRVEGLLAQMGPTSTLDGTKVRLPGAGWILARASNTEPVLSLRFEGSSEAAFKEIQKSLSRLLAAEGLVVDLSEPRSP